MRPPLLTLALLGPLPATAFYPTKFRANLSTTPGISHEQMTEEVLTAAAGALFPPVISSLTSALGAPLSRGMLEARTEIVRSNVRVDWGYPIPAFHFDGESDSESVQLLEGLKAGLVKHLAEGNYRAARINLGNALHIVQDYFAYRFVFVFVACGGWLGKLWLTEAVTRSRRARTLSSCGRGISFCRPRWEVVALGLTRTKREKAVCAPDLPLR